MKKLLLVLLFIGAAWIGCKAENFTVRKVDIIDDYQVYLKVNELVDKVNELENKVNELEGAVNSLREVVNRFDGLLVRQTPSE